MPHSFHIALLFLSVYTIGNAERIPWTTSKIQGSPEPPPPYQAEVIWPHISFTNGLDITLLASEEKLFITEQHGKIWWLPADLSAAPDAAQLVGNFRELVPGLDNILALAFHPDFQRTREAFAYYSADLNGQFKDMRASRFKLDENLRFVPGSLKPILEYEGSGHVGGDLQFGPDGMLYLSVGDLSPPSPPDRYDMGQDLKKWGSKILRIDVVNTEPGQPYRVPEDNPFIDFPGARPETWAYGFRNPWKICFHPETGNVWTGDVGWEAWEMVYRVQKGDNFGWPINEGPVPLRSDLPPGPTPILPPLAYYSHVEGSSITGGYFVTNPRIPELQGAYIYGDYVTGRIWALDWDGEKVTQNRLIADSRKGIVSFGQDKDGDLIFLNHPADGHLYRLVPTKEYTATPDFPRTLSESGLFSDVGAETPSPGVYSFKINAPTWQESYRSRYWIGLPGNGRIDASVGYRDGLPLLRYEKPNDTVLAKTIHKDGRRIETQILHYDGYWNGYSYQWNEAQTDATLVPKDGLDTVIDGKSYRFPARSECVRCHGSNFHRPLAFHPGQVDRDGQLEKLKSLGLVNQEFVEVASLQKMADPKDESASLDTRARSWIQTNCAHCHRVSGGAGVTSLMNRGVPTDSMGLINSHPEKGGFGIENGSLIDPGNPYRSIFYYRINTLGAGHMPMIGFRTPDEEGIELIHDWIRSMAPETPIPDPTLKPSNVEQALALMHRIRSGKLSKAKAQQAIDFCMKSTDPFIINLFAGFSLE